MKKIIQISFAVVYLFLTTGFTVTLHFCGGEISDVSIVRTHGDEDPCGCDSSCGDTCCTDDVTTIKLSDSHKSEAKFVQNSFELLVTFFHVENFPNTGNNEINFSTNHIHSDSDPPPLYLYNCTFLI
ncbi:MAG: hypothetical protein RDU14_06855 [Melioribacteraceae bacterium]|nr:hypothetical protein [Melioribacteraceae bacterium]